MQDAIAAQDASLAGRVSTLVEALGALPTARPAKLFDQKHLRDDLAKVLRVSACRTCRGPPRWAS